MNHCCKGACGTPEGVVTSCIFVVEAHGDAHDPRIPQPLRYGFVKQSAVDCDDQPEPLLSGIRYDFKNVFPQQGLAPGENDSRSREGGNAVYYLLALGYGQLILKGAAAGPRPAVHAIEVAITRQLPRNHSERGSAGRLRSLLPQGAASMCLVFHDP